MSEKSFSNQRDLIIPALNPSHFIERDGDFWMTAKTIGEMLGYSDSANSVLKIYERHQEQFTDFSVTDKLTGTDGKLYEQRIFSEEGIYLCTMYANTKKARFFQIEVAKFLKAERHRREGQHSTSSSPDNALALVQMAAGGYENLDKKIEAYRAEWKADQSKQTSHIFSQNFQTDDAIDRLEMQLSNLNIRIVKAENLLRRLHGEKK